jgi:nitrite reductase/ring-hydroxylating ferredoxin subunit
VIRKGDQSPKQAKRVGTQLGGERVFDLSRIAVDSLQPVSEDVCVARIGEDEVVAFGRRCPHEGADLALGYVSNGEVVCPWHDVRFDSTSGKTACQSLKGLRFFETRVADGKVTVNLESRVG